MCDNSSVNSQDVLKKNNDMNDAAECENIFLFQLIKQLIKQF